ncbi:MAG: N-acetyltransferase [Hyphomicrobiales bacterium]|nr:N-acetyltransferase [Hyphomicrobiales bacterium]
MTSVVMSAAPARGFVLADERAADVFAREKLLDAAMGPGRRRKTSERLRAGRAPALAILARDETGRVIGTVRLWHVAAGGVPALLLGPLAVAADRRCDGVGAALMREAISRARALGHGAILLVGDAPYYTRFGFSRRATERLQMPGPVELGRFLGLELREGWLAGAEGKLRATGVRTESAPRRSRHAA